MNFLKHACFWSVEEEQQIKQWISGKKVLFISPTDADYIRNRQEIELLKAHAAHVHQITFDDRGRLTFLSIKKILSTLIRTFGSLHRPFDTVFIGGMPQVILPLIYPFVWRKQLVIDFFISMYDTLVQDRARVSERSPTAKFLKGLDVLTLSLADRVIVDTRAHGLYFKESFGLKKPWTVLYLKADDRIYYPRTVSKSPELAKKFIVFFFGAMNPLQGVDTLLTCAKSLRDVEDIVFTLVGPVDKLSQETQSLLDLPNVRLLSTWMKQEELADCIAMADLCIAGHLNKSIGKGSRVIPGKAYIYLSMEKMTVLGDNPANRELFSDSSPRIIWVRMGDPEHLKKAILSAFNKQSETVSR